MVPALRDILLESRLLASTGMVFNEKRVQGKRQRDNPEIKKGRSVIKVVWEVISRAIVRWIVEREQFPHLLS